MAEFWRKISRIVACLIATIWVDTTFAADNCASPSDDCVAVGRWNLSVALGAGVRTNPLIGSRDIPLVVIPQFSYYGKHFFIDNLDPGVTLFESDVNTVSLVASPGYDRVFFYRSDLQNFFVGGFTNYVGSAGGFTAGNPPPTTLQQQQVPLPSRKITYLAGPEWTFKSGRLVGQLDYLHEITGRNHGDEVRAGLGIGLGEWQGTWRANLGFTWKSAAIVNYYYGVPGLYEAGPVLNPFIKLGYSRPLSSQWKLDAFVHCERLGKGITDSPIVGQHYVTTAFIGATYVLHK